MGHVAANLCFRCLFFDNYLGRVLQEGRLSCTTIANSTVSSALFKTVIFAKVLRDGWV